MGWRQGWQLAINFWGRYSPTQLKGYQELARVFTNEGCAGLQLLDNKSIEIDVTSGDLCSGVPDQLNVAMFCPVACGCTESSHSACPPDCDRRDRNNLRGVLKNLTGQR